MINLRFCPGISLEVLRKSTTNLRTKGLWVEIRTWNLLDTKQSVTYSTAMFSVSEESAASTFRVT
jgi:hypothetical protein